jgi:hypothetical protein
MVRGRMSSDLIEALSDFSVETTADGLSRIVGSIPDQPRLLSILGAFDDLHVEVVSVNQVG